MPLDTARLVKVGTAVGGLAGGVVALTTAWTTFNLPVLATRTYVHDELRKLVEPVMGLAEEQRARIRRKREDDVKRLATATDSQAKWDIQAIIEQDDQDIAVVAAWIAALERMRGSK